jgi:hypothetical protein
MKHKRGAAVDAHRLLPSLAHWVFPAVVILLATFIFGDTVWRHAALSAVSSVRTAEAAIDSRTISPEAELRSTIPPAQSLDARWWIIYAEQQLEEGRLRIRRNFQDNHPAGREIHWSSLPTWALSAVSVGTSFFSGRPASRGVQDAALFFGPVTLAASLCLLGWLAWRVFTPAITGFFLLAFSVSPLVYQAFRPGEVDHHGMVLTFLLAGFLALLVAGKIHPDGTQRRGTKSSAAAVARWVWAAGFFHGAALWISASSTIPLLVGCALGAVAAALVLRPGLIAPRLWQTWGVAGGLASIFFYLIEYFPQHMGWRLEVNHPLWSLAWMGGAFWLSQVLTMLAGQKIVWSRHWAGQALPALVFLLLPVVLVARFPAQTFLVSDPFLLDLHKRFISEFQSLPAHLAGNGLFPGLIEAGLLPALTLCLTGFMLTSRSPLPDFAKTSVAFLVPPVMVIQALALWQIRWGITAVGFWALLAAVCLAAVLSLRGIPRISALVATSLAAALLLAAYPLAVWLGLNQRASLAGQMPKSGIPAILSRDLAHRLVQASGMDVPVVLSAPTTSTDLAYFGGIKVLGTLYWENRDGLVRAARIFAEPSPAKVKEMLLESGVNFILVPTWEDFVTPYTELLGGNSGEDKPFFRLLTAGQTPPVWLRPLHYPVADGFDIGPDQVRLYRFMPTQTPAQAALHLGIYHAERMEWEEARTALARAAKLDPLEPSVAPWLRQIEISQKNQTPTKP